MDVIILIRLLLAHILVRYMISVRPLRADRLVERLVERRPRMAEVLAEVFPRLAVLLPSVTEAVVAYAFCGRYEAVWLLPFVFVFSAASHKAEGRKPPTARRFILAEILFLLGTLIAWLGLNESFLYAARWLLELSENVRAGWIILGYFTCLWPLDRLISIATRRWRMQMPESEGLNEAGKWIGKLERVLILTFVLVQHFEAIGFLITAKSIIRFNDLKQSTQKKEAEYVLIGTLMSFSACILLGLGILKLSSP